MHMKDKPEVTVDAVWVTSRSSRTIHDVGNKSYMSVLEKNFRFQKVFSYPGLHLIIKVTLS